MTKQTFLSKVLKKDDDKPKLTDEDVGLIKKFLKLKSVRLYFYAFGIIGIAFGLWLLVWGVLHMKTACTASPLFATSVVVLGSVLTVQGIAAFAVPEAAWTALPFFLSFSVYFGILIWATVQMADDGLWSKTRNGKGNELCTLSFYNPAAISVICGWLLHAVIMILISVLSYLIYGETLRDAMRHEAEKKGLISGDDGSGNTGNGPSSGSRASETATP